MNRQHNVRVKQILSMIEQDTSRDEIARKLGYDNVKPVDQFMRRHGYNWSKLYHAYERKQSTQDRTAQVCDSVVEVPKVPEKVARIQRRLKESDVDFGLAARVEGFRNPEEMAQYLKSQGYIWSSEDANYVFGGLPESPVEQLQNDGPAIKVQPRELALVGASAISDVSTANEVQMEGPARKDESVQAPQIGHRGDTVDQDQLMAYLSEHPEVLDDARFVTRGLQVMIRYRLPGYRVPKSMQIDNGLKAYLKDFCYEFRLTENEVIESAIIEFLRRHGYRERVASYVNGPDSG